MYGRPLKDVLLGVFLSNIQLRRFSKVLIRLGFCFQLISNSQRAKQLIEQFSYKKSLWLNKGATVLKNAL